MVTSEGSFDLLDESGLVSVSGVGGIGSLVGCVGGGVGGVGSGVRGVGVRSGVAGGSSGEAGRSGGSGVVVVFTWRSAREEMVLARIRLECQEEVQERTSQPGPDGSSVLVSSIDASSSPVVSISSTDASSSSDGGLVVLASERVGSLAGGEAVRGSAVG